MDTLVSKAQTLIFIIRSSDLSEKSERIDRVLSRLEGLPSRSQLKAWFEGGCIQRGSEVLSAASRVSEGDRIEVRPPASKPSVLEARKLGLKIYHEDEDLIVLYKPRGLSMHPGAAGLDETTLVHGLLAHADELSDGGEEFRPGIVHRLDKDTEGIVVVAKNNETHEALSLQFAERSIDRAYWALVWGKFPRELLIDAPIGRSPRDRKKMAVVSRGKSAQTHVKLLKYFDEGYSWVECKLHTGRTHQIRVHLSHKKFPVLRDPVYSKPRKTLFAGEKLRVYDELKGQALMAYRLGFIHPRTNEKMFFEAEQPEWLIILTKA